MQEETSLRTKILNDIVKQFDKFSNFSLEKCNECENILKSMSHLPIVRINYNPISGFTAGYKNFAENNSSLMHIYHHRMNVMLLPYLNSLNFQQICNKEFSFFTFSYDPLNIFPSQLSKFFDSVPFIYPTRPIGNYNNIISIPDYYSLTPEFGNMIDLIKQSSIERPFHLRKQCAGFRGSQTGSNRRYDMNSFTSIPRLKLVMMSYDHPNYIDARFINHTNQVYNSPNGKEYTEFMDKTFGKTNFVPFHEMTQYRYNISMDGNGGTWQRPAHIMFTGSVPLFQRNYDNYFTPYLQENVNYISFKEDLSDLIPKIEYLNNNPDFAKAIAHNAVNFADQVLTPEFIRTYILKLFKSLSEKFV